MPKVTTITFDLDNTLWDIDTVISSAEIKTQEWLCNQENNLDGLFEQKNSLPIREKLIAETPDLENNLTQLRKDFLYAAIIQRGYKPNKAKQLASSAFKIFYEERHNVTFFEGALEILEQLRNEFTLGALTNGNANYQKLGLSKYFSFGLSAADVNAAKPDAAMFLAGLQRAKANPDQAIHVGDNLVDDIWGANQVGIRTIWVNLNNSPRSNQDTVPNATVLNLWDIPGAIHELSAL